MIKIDIYYNNHGSCMVSCKGEGLRKKSFPYAYFWGNTGNAKQALLAYTKLHGLPAFTLLDNTKTGDYIAVENKELTL